MTIDELAQLVFSDASLVRAVLSDPVSAGGLLKVSFKKIDAKGRTGYQAEILKNTQAFHENLDPKEAAAAFRNYMAGEFRQAALFCPDADYQVLVSKKGTSTILKKPASQPAAKVPASYNRVKKYLLPEGLAVPWLVETGIMGRDGTVVKSRYDKYRQINKYLEFIEDCLASFDETETIRIVDFGCGKAYLTFALYDWLVNRKKRKASITGLDLKPEVIADCAKLAKKLGFADLNFAQGDISEYAPGTDVDMMICLHACDTATDAAIAKAVSWNARVILAVPCCQKELIQKIAVAGFEPMLQHGFLRERFGSMATDTLRALALDAMGYKTVICEFIDMEHTPKNTLIRAIKPGKGKAARNQAAIKKYVQFRDLLGVKPSLEEMLGSGFSAALKETEGK